MGSLKNHGRPRVLRVRRILARGCRAPPARGGQPIQLAPKTHDVLVALLRRTRGLVTKRELLAEVWPEAFVEEGILAVHISALRRALNGSSEISCIQTVSRSGYRFTAPVIERHSTQPIVDTIAR
jgi:DNA-binding winged helix-turn-helix (wHTH) protein